MLCGERRNPPFDIKNIMIGEVSMGLLSLIFGAKSEVEIRLEKQLIPVFQIMMRLSDSEAKNLFKKMIKQAKKESQQEGTCKLPINYGDILIEKESLDEKTKTFLDKRRKEGVTDQDIIWWWNMHDLERRMLMKIADYHRMIMYLHTLDQGMSQNVAANKVKKYHPIFGDSENESIDSGADRPLPHELRDRIDIYIERRCKNDPEKYKTDIAVSSSFNALVRKEIARGNL